MTDADYGNDLAHVANTPTQAESHLHSLEQAAGDINFSRECKKIVHIF